MIFIQTKKGYNLYSKCEYLFKPRKNLTPSPQEEEGSYSYKDNRHKINPIHSE